MRQHDRSLRRTHLLLNNAGGETESCAAVHAETKFVAAEEAPTGSPTAPIRRSSLRAAQRERERVGIGVRAVSGERGRFGRRRRVRYRRWEW